MHIANTHSHSDAESALDTPSSHRVRNGLVMAFVILFAIFLLGFIPPLINVSRFQHRIANNIGNSIGRPVHFDRVSLSLLPLPGFTLENFVIDEDPAFGYEPILRADEVHATLRIASLWSSHVEFSRISLTEPTSVNLVRNADGRWNVESLLLQASHIDAAPTAQRFSSAAPRFPYVEATGARVNLKLGQEKTPFSLTDADFALWLPEPHQWHLRLEAHPARTDLSPGDTGILHAEGTLGGNGAGAGPSGNALAQVPIDLHGSWQDAQLGDLSRLLSGSDAGVRGDLSMTFAILGTFEVNTVTTDIQLANARRADFVPSQPLSLEVGCRATARQTFHSLTSIECHWPPVNASAPSVLALAASLPDVRTPQSATGQVTVSAVPASSLVNWLRVATPHPPTGLDGPGSLSGTVAWGPDPKSSQPTWTGELTFSDGALDLGIADQNPIPLGEVVLHSTPPAPAPPHHRRAAKPADLPADSFDLLPVSLDLGGKTPATLEGHLDATGYTLHLSGSAIPSRLLALGAAVPQLGDGLKDRLERLAIIPSADPSAAAQTTGQASRGGVRGNAILPDTVPTAATPDADQPTHIDLTATRAWGGPQTWSTMAAPATHTRPRR